MREPLIIPSTSDGENQQRHMRRVETFSENGGDLDVYRRSLLSSHISSSIPEADEPGLPCPHPGGDTFVVTTISLSKVILGSGMLVGEMRLDSQYCAFHHPVLSVHACPRPCPLSCPTQSSIYGTYFPRPARGIDKELTFGLILNLPSRRSFLRPSRSSECPLGWLCSPWWA